MLCVPFSVVSYRHHAIPLVAKGEHEEYAPTSAVPGSVQMN